MTTPDIAGMKRLHGDGAIDDTEALQQRLNAAPDIAGLCERLKTLWLELNDAHAEPPATARIMNALHQSGNTLERQAAEIERLRKALKPFAAAGQAIDANGFGVAIFPNDSRAFESSWSENGQDHQLTWGDFRRAALTGEDA